MNAISTCPRCNGWSRCRRRDRNTTVRCPLCQAEYPLPRGVGVGSSRVDFRVERREPLCRRSAENRRFHDRFRGASGGSRFPFCEGSEDSQTAFDAAIGSAIVEKPLNRPGNIASERMKEMPKTKPLLKTAPGSAKTQEKRTRSAFWIEWLFGLGAAVLDRPTTAFGGFAANRRACPGTIGSPVCRRRAMSGIPVGPRSPAVDPKTVPRSAEPAEEKLYRIYG